MVSYIEWLNPWRTATMKVAAFCASSSRDMPGL
jgi:hypothetical protein